VFVRNVPLTGGASSSSPDGVPDVGAAGLGELLDVAPRVGSALPCREAADADLWFADSPADLERAKALCAGCPVKAACLAGALDRGEPWGVWGGEIFERGSVIARKRPRGRPSKAALARDRELAAAGASL
jgi:WhiB family redox-sensing transcriptional regulator